MLSATCIYSEPLVKIEAIWEKGLALPLASDSHACDLLVNGEKKNMETARKKVVSEEQLKAIFKAHDINGNGHLNREELKAAFRKLGAFVPGWRAKRAIYYTDIDIDGVISEGEIDQLVVYAVECGYKLDD
ncbi:hypothetical protein Ancab_021521 [Ancistrocladus abbreviatus]